MIRGLVNPRHEAVVRVRVRGPGGVECVMDALVDSGFTSSLTVPVSAATALSLVRQSVGTATLGDGSVRQFDVYAAEVEWDGAWRPVLAWGVGNESLLGMGLLAGHQLRIEVKPGGVVEIAPLP